MSRLPIDSGLQHVDDHSLSSDIPQQKVQCLLLWKQGTFIYSKSRHLSFLEGWGQPFLREAQHCPMFLKKKATTSMTAVSNRSLSHNSWVKSGLANLANPSAPHKAISPTDFGSNNKCFLIMTAWKSIKLVVLQKCVSCPYLLNRTSAELL